MNTLAPKRLFNHNRPTLPVSLVGSTLAIST